MCKYCKPIGAKNVSEWLYHGRKKITQTIPKNIQIIDNKNRYVGINIIIENEILHIMSIPLYGESTFIEIPIKYCPMCGEKLID